MPTPGVRVALRIGMADVSSRHCALAGPRSRSVRARRGRPADGRSVMTRDRNRKLRAALVGAGYVSEYHVRAIDSLEFVEIVGICDVDALRRERLASRCHCAGVDEVAALAPLRPDVVHVLTPPATHCEVTRQALGLGCDVFVEKPMALTAVE